MKKTKTLALVALLAVLLVSSLAFMACGGKKVTDVELNKTNLTLSVGSSETLTATVSPEGATDKTVMWSSSAPAIASVNSSGRVTAVGAGEATITVTTTDGNKTATCAVTVTPSSVGGVTLNKTQLGMQIGNKETLVPTVMPASAGNKAVTWTSSNPGVASVSTGGEVEAKTLGTTTVTVTTVDQSKVAACEISVISKEISSAADFAKINLKLDGEFYLTKDIDFGGGFADAIGTWASGSDQKFTGTFDGKGFALSNLEMSRSAIILDNGQVWGNALFCQIGVSGVVKNLNIINLKAHGDGSCAGIAGSNYGVIENCYVEANIYNDSGLKQSSAGGTLVGTNYGTVRNSIANCKTNRTFTFAGNNHGTIEKCFSVVDSVKGIENPSEQYAFYTTEEEDLPAGYDLGEFKNCTAFRLDDLAIAKGTAGYVDFSVLTNTSAWKASGTAGAGPYLATAANTVRSWLVLPEALEGTQEITTLDQLLSIGENRATRKADYVLKNDIDVGSIDWVSLGEFAGTFDGKGHKLYNMTSSTGTGNLGLFETVAASGVVKNLTIVGRTDGEYTKYAGWNGAICQNNYGKISNCLINVRMLAELTSEGYGYVGGVVCNNETDGIIENCVVLGEIKGLGTAAQQSWGESHARNGGIVQDGNRGTVTDCYFDIDAANAGNTNKDTIKNQPLVLYGVGTANAVTGMEKTTQEMKTASLYSGWSTAVWNIVNGQYPSLKIIA